MLLSCQKSCQHYTYVNILLIENPDWPIIPSNIQYTSAQSKPDKALTENRQLSP